MIAILDPFSGIAGDMTLGALLDLGLDPEWLRALPDTLGLKDIGRADRAREARARSRAGRWISTFRRSRTAVISSTSNAIVDASPAPEHVKAKARAAFEAVATVEAEIHGTTVEKVHLHEVGAVDAILDIVGSIWGLDLIGVDAVYCGTIALGDGFVDAAHGRLAVPAPATLRLLEGQSVRYGPPESGELTTPTGAALVRVLSRGAAPGSYRPLKSGYGAGTKDPEGARERAAGHTRRAATRDAEEPRRSSSSPSDIDDMTGEYMAAAADLIREAGALDVTLLQTIMKKGRPGVRIEVLCRPADAARLEALLLRESSTIGVRRTRSARRALARSEGERRSLRSPGRGEDGAAAGRRRTGEGRVRGCPPRGAGNGADDGRDSRGDREEELNCEKR